jgi:hypothetical protein
MKKNKNRVWHFLYKLHRYIGLLSALVIIMLAITGILLNHTEELQLDSNLINSTDLLDWYGIKSPDPLTAFATKNHWVSQINNQIYFDNSPLITDENSLLGAVENSNFIVIAFRHSLLLISKQGEIIEQTPIDSIKKIGVDQSNAIAILSNKTLLISNNGLLSWDANADLPISWAKQQPLPESLAIENKRSFRSSILPMERVILDLHSGRFFGYAGVIIVDICGVFLIVLALSGCAIWLKHKLRNIKFLRSS